MGTGKWILSLMVVISSLTATFASSWRSPYTNFDQHTNWKSQNLNHKFHDVHRSRQNIIRHTALRWEQTRVSAQSTSRLRYQGLEAGFYYSRVFYVTDNGADPSGQKDSTDALQKTINDAFAVGSSHDLDPGIPDLGGVEVHLEGGEYLISFPLQLPASGGGNVVIHGGTLRANASFPTGHYLLEMWSAAGMKRRSNRTVASLRDRSHSSVNCLKDYIASYEDITIRDMMFDANYQAGGLLIVDSIRVNVENLYMSHYATDGILIEGSNEIYVQNSYFGHFISTVTTQHEEDASGVAINIISNDNVLSNILIFSGDVGVQISGQGNLLTGIHAYNKPTDMGGIGIHLQLPGYSQTRILNSYLDGTGIVADDPAQVDISHNFFNGDAYVLLRSTRVDHSIEQVIIMFNMFAGSWRGVPIVQLNQKMGSFAFVDRTIVDQNTAYGMNLKATVARASVSGYGKKFSTDLSDRLLFPNRIQNVQYSLFIPTSNTYTRHALRSVLDNRVVVEAEYKVSGTLTVVVDQSSDILYTVGSITS
ncbi:hypothetical protein R1flu_025120 [Riccia fluitans]|uniref:Pectate lyase superfamily protein domain-containing protein n=1 Tax=Riccia fluitans TaxID=41844 RepID=A0ABD1XXR9_9MARC